MGAAASLAAVVGLYHHVATASVAWVLPLLVAARCMRRGGGLVGREAALAVGATLATACTTLASRRELHGRPIFLAPPCRQPGVPPTGNAGQGLSPRRRRDPRALLRKVKSTSGGPRPTPTAELHGHALTLRDAQVVSLFLKPPLLKVQPWSWASFVPNCAAESDAEVTPQARSASPGAVDLDPFMLHDRPASPVGSTAVASSRGESARFRWPFAQRHRGQSHDPGCIIQCCIKHRDVSRRGSRVAGQGILSRLVCLGIAVGVTPFHRIDDRGEVHVRLDLLHALPPPQLSGIGMRMPHYAGVAFPCAELCLGPRRGIAHHVLAVPVHRGWPSQVLGSHRIRRVLRGLRRLR